jgi:hypothetical protein
MQLPVKISYRGLEKSDQIDNLVLEYAARLERFCDHINRCDVAIEQRNHAHHKGNPYHVRIDVTVRGRHELVAREERMDNGTHQPLNKVIVAPRGGQTTAGRKDARQHAFAEVGGGD